MPGVAADRVLILLLLPLLLHLVWCLLRLLECVQSALICASLYQASPRCTRLDVATHTCADTLQLTVKMYGQPDALNHPLRFLCFATIIFAIITTSIQVGFPSLSPSLSLNTSPPPPPPLQKKKKGLLRLPRASALRLVDHPLHLLVPLLLPIRRPHRRRRARHPRTVVPRVAQPLAHPHLVAARHLNTC